MIEQHGIEQRGAPVGNRNALRHGLRAGRLPSGCGAIRRSIDQLRRQLEDAVMQAHGEIDILRAAMIQTAIRHERHAMLAQRWLRMFADTMQPMERLAYSRDIAKASDSRDKSIAALNICENQADTDPAALMRARAAQSAQKRIGQADVNVQASNPNETPDVILETHIEDDSQ